MCVVYIRALVCMCERTLVCVLEMLSNLKFHVTFHDRIISQNLFNDKYSHWDEDSEDYDKQITQIRTLYYLLA